MTVRLVSGPAVLPVSLADAKAHLRIDQTDEDAFIESLIKAAVAHFDGDGVLGRAMITQTWSQWVSQAPGYVSLKMSPFQALSSVQYYDADNVLQSADTSDFETWLALDQVVVKPKKGFTWPRAYTRPDAIQITYTAGFGDAASDVPEGITQAILMTVTHWYENRSAVSEGSFKEMPLAVASLIGRERVGWYG